MIAHTAPAFTCGSRCVDGTRSSINAHNETPRRLLASCFVLLSVCPCELDGQDPRIARILSAAVGILGYPHCAAASPRRTSGPRRISVWSRDDDGCCSSRYDGQTPRGPLNGHGTVARGHLETCSDASYFQLRPSPCMTLTSLILAYLGLSLHLFLARSLHQRSHPLMRYCIPILRCE